MIEQLVKDFDPESNETDRRIYYEVTGIKLDENDFKDEDSMNSSDDENSNENALSTSLNMNVMQADSTTQALIVSEEMKGNH